MRLLLVGAGGVGSAIASIASRRDFFERMIVADCDLGRAERAVQHAHDPRLTACKLDASDRSAIAALLREHQCTMLVNATDPRFVMPLFEAALAAGVDYLDLAMSLSRPNSIDPYRQPGLKLGDEQFAMKDTWEQAGHLALLGMGVEPGLSDIFARYAADHLFSEIDEIGVRDGSNLHIEGPDGAPLFVPTFSIWATIEECLNPPVVWERDQGWYTTPLFSEPEVFNFPEGIGPVECVNVEHEEVLLLPRWLKAQRVTFKYGLGADFIQVLKTLHRLGLDRVVPVSVASGQGLTLVSPRDVVAACLPDPLTLGNRMRGKTCAGTWVTGKGKDGLPREVYLYHVVDNSETMASYGAQAVVWQTALNPVVALELISRGAWSGCGVLGPEAFDALPFLELLATYGFPWKIREGRSLEPTPALRRLNAVPQMQRSPDGSLPSPFPALQQR